jgi:hypothetical protein
MKQDQGNQLDDRGKNLIAMGAAMGAGCRKCADKLHALAVTMKILDDEMLKAFQWGLDAKAKAAETMRAKVEDLLGCGCSRTGLKKEADHGPARQQHSDPLIPLVRIASFIAANSAPDAAAEIAEARSEGVTEDRIRLCISIGKMVRKNAQAFSDGEIEEIFAGEIKEFCCPLAPESEKESGCSCT